MNSRNELPQLTLADHIVMMMHTIPTIELQYLLMQIELELDYRNGNYRE